MELVRTPASRFVDLPEYPFAENYLEIPFKERRIRMHYVDEGGPSAETVVLLHGEPSWSFLYRKVIPPLVAAGRRVIAPDLVGFGKSDKPTRISDFTYARQEEWLRAALFDVLGLSDITVYGQDWGGLLSLRLVAFHPERFARVMMANTGLPAGGKDSNFLPGDAPRKPLVYLGIRTWQTFARYIPVFPIGFLAQQLASETKLSATVRYGYRAPFPSNRYMAGPRAMPGLIPTDRESEASRRNREAWQSLARFDKPFRTAFSDKDVAVNLLPVARTMQDHVPGATGQRHVTIPNAGHFLQEDRGELVARELNSFIDENPRR